MSAYLYATGDVVVTSRPCTLVGILVTTDGGGPGKVVLYDERSAVSGREIATILCSANSSKSVRFHNLKTQRGLYLEFVEKADYVTIVWDPAGS